MPRALRVVRTGARATTRAEALATFRATRARAGAASCNYWVFEETDGTGAWVEFFEAADADTLRTALRQLQPSTTPDPILREVELG